jgi:hypothetical protein
MADIAHVLHWPLAELDAMTVDEICYWHEEAARLLRSDG